MIRVTNSYMSNNLVKTLNRQSKDLDLLRNQITTQNRIQAPHEDPEGTSMVMLYRSKMKEFSRYENNIGDSVARLNFLDNKLQEVNAYLQNVRQGAVRGANGTLNQSDRENLAMELEQYLRQLVSVANSDFNGDSLFSGYKTDTRPFAVSYENGSRDSFVSNVRYEGGDGRQYREVEQGEYIGINLSGNKVFWSSNQRITSQTNATGYLALSKDASKPYQSINIDGLSIRIDDGDNLNTIVDKINNSSLAIKAEIDNTTGNDFIVLSTTKPHEIWLSDEEGGTVLQDLGLISEGGASYPPNNYAQSAVVHGKSLFDEIIDLRNSLLKDDINGVNRGILGLDMAMDNVRTNMASVGALQSRLDIATEQMSKNVVYANDIYSKVQATPVMEAITNMKQLDFAHQTALQIGARIIRPTLLDFLR